jgi:hypothetical protein
MASYVVRVPVSGCVDVLVCGQPDEQAAVRRATSLANNSTPFTKSVRWATGDTGEVTVFTDPLAASTILSVDGQRV